MASGTPTQVLHAAEEAEKLYQAQIDELSGTGSTGPTGEEVLSATGEIGATGEEEEIVEETSEQKEKRTPNIWEPQIYY